MMIASNAFELCVLESTYHIYEFMQDILRVFSDPDINLLEYLTAHGGFLK